MDRVKCVNIASYLVPLSIYEFTDNASVDEVFRRINSGGRQLSRQELRTAGATCAFADVVRIISSKVRGDTSASDTLILNDMQNISITNRELDYGIDVDSVFWISNGILSRDHLRQSRDEELVADIVGYMASDEPISSRTEFLDDFYGNVEGDKASDERFQKIDSSIKKRSTALFAADFQRTLDTLSLTLAAAEMTFTQLLFGKAVAPMPRYFQAVFLAFYKLTVMRNMEVADRAGLIKALNGKGANISIQEGGRWGGENRATAINSVEGIIQSYFKEAKNTDPAVVHWVNQFQNILMQSRTEQAAYDFKCGFVILDETNRFDDNSFEKILKTCVAIANIGPAQKGYVLVGVSETAETATRVEKVFGATPLTYENFYISGVEHEAKSLGKSLDQMFQLIVDKVRNSKISEPLKAYITANMKSVRYFEKTAFIFEIDGQKQPSLFGDKFYTRVGTQIAEVPPVEFSNLYARFS